jgi:hypothetical protein
MIRVIYWQNALRVGEVLDDSPPIASSEQQGEGAILERLPVESDQARLQSQDSNRLSHIERLQRGDCLSRNPFS